MSKISRKRTYDEVSKLSSNVKKARLNLTTEFVRNEINDFQNQIDIIKRKMDEAAKFKSVAMRLNTLLESDFKDRKVIPVYDEDIPEEARERIEIFFKRAELVEQIKGSFRVCKGIYKKQPVYNVFRGTDKAKVYLTTRIRASDFHLFSAGGTKSMGPCDGFECYMFAKGFSCGVLPFDPLYDTLETRIQQSLWKLL